MVKIVRKADASPAQERVMRVGAVVCALAASALVLAVLGFNPFVVFGKIVEGSLLSGHRLVSTLNKTIPLVVLSLGIAIAFKMKFWNIGAEGQITAGAVGASYFALFWADKLPGPVLLVVMAVSGAICGGLWALVPAFFKAKWGTNETLFTLMMNYIMIGVVKWLQGGPWEGRPGSQIIPQFDSAAVLPKVLGVHCGWIIVLILTVAMFFYMKYTKQGYEIAVIGESEKTARYAGMNVGKIIMRTMFLSGAIAGLVGFIVASGADNTLYSGVAAGVGFTAITVAWLAQLNPFAMVGISVLLGVLDKGADTLQTQLAVPASISDIITGIFLFCMLGCEFFINYRLIFRGSHKEVAK